VISAPDFDVIVVGGGGGGLAAAATAAAAGVSVLVAEAAAEVGGATALSGGSFMAAGTPVQAAAGYPGDTADEFFDHYLTFNRWQADPAVARRFCDQATATMAWLGELGVEFRPENLYRAARERVPRTHRPTGGGLAIVEALHRACRDAGVEFALGNRVDDLLVSDGRVTGVRSRGEELTAHAVIITTGGFGGNPGLFAEHFPDAGRGGGEPWSPEPATCAGDGLRLGARAGAATGGRNRGELLLSTGFARDLEPFVPGWMVYVTPGGRRFVNEAAPYTVITPTLLAQADWCWAIFDEAARTSATAPVDARWGMGSWIGEVLLAEARKGRVLTADTMAGLAAVTGMPPVTLAATVDRYNADGRAGADTRFGKDPAAMKPIATPPFYAVRLRPLVVAVTGFGLLIDADARVLREADGEPVAGLFAAGEVTGNVIGAQYLGGGNAIGSALIFGRVAGRAAAGRAALITGGVH
jgi:succinate dehydrogenase/fumarate reductase flavoprotein subunit